MQNYLKPSLVKLRFADVVPLTAITILACFFLTMPEAHFLTLLQSIEQFGIAVACLESLLMFSAMIALLVALKSERRKSIWTKTVMFTVIILAANLLDYFSTLAFSPDLAMENNPVWNTIVRLCGLNFALLYGFCGKITLSIFAGICFAFYLSNVEVLFPHKRQSFPLFVMHIGEGNRNGARRRKALATVLCFYFAMMNLFCFYVAYINSLVNDPHALESLPAFPGAIIIALILITIAFPLCTFACQRGRRRGAYRPAPDAH